MQLFAQGGHNFLTLSSTKNYLFLFVLQTVLFDIIHLLLYVLNHSSLAE